MTEKHIIPHASQLASVGIRGVPALFLDAGEKAWWRFVEFFTANIRNRNTREAYGRAVLRFSAWCTEKKLDLHQINPFLIAAYIEELGTVLSPPSVKQHLAAVRMLFDYLVTGQIVPIPGAARDERSAGPRTEPAGVQARVAGVSPLHEHPERVLRSRAGLLLRLLRERARSPFPGTIVFTCLSQDVIAHELTHALLMGMNIEFDPGTQPGRPGVPRGVRRPGRRSSSTSGRVGRAARTRSPRFAGDLDERSPLGAVALQFGQAIGQPDGLRNALGTTDDGGHLAAAPARPEALSRRGEPHDRGDILVGAVFDAFKKIYESRVGDLRRIATRAPASCPRAACTPTW